MMSVKEELLKGYKHSLELANQRIAELSKPCVKSLAFSRSEERDLLKKRAKRMKAQLKELEDDGRIKEKS